MEVQVRWCVAVCVCVCVCVCMHDDVHRAVGLFLSSQKRSDALTLKLGMEARKHDYNSMQDEDLRSNLQWLSIVGKAILP